PHGKATVVGTQFGVDVAPDGSLTEVRVIKGKVYVFNSRSGTEALIQKGGFAILGDHLETGALTEPTPDRDRALLAQAKREAGITDDTEENVDDSAKLPKEEGLSAEAPKARHLEKVAPGPLAQPAS